MILMTQLPHVDMYRSGQVSVSNTVDPVQFATPQDSRANLM